MESNNFLNSGVRNWLQQGRWLVGVSGGGDSVALLKLLVEAGFGPQLVVGNFEHGWGEFGAESQKFVQALADEVKLEFRSGRGGGKAATNAEAVAREERYGWFKEICAAEGLEGVIVAHTREDVVETFLMRAGKGSGLGGLAGMRAEGEVRGVKVVRPLLEAGREELREYLRACEQDWMEDPDNAAGGSQRARVRKLLPALEEAGITLHGLAASVAALGDAEALVAECAREYSVWGNKDEALLWRAPLLNIPVEMAARVMARVIGQVGGDAMVRRSKRLALWQRIRDAPEGAATLGGAKFVWQHGTVMVKAE